MPRETLKTSPPRAPIVDAILALLGLVLILRNAETVLIGLRLEAFHFVPTAMLVLGVVLCIHAFRSWRAARVSAPAATATPAAPRAPANSATPAAPAAPAAPKAAAAPAASAASPKSAAPPKSATPELMTLRSLAVAQKFPQELPDGAAHKARGEAHVCSDDGSALVPILITTYGDFGDPAVWREYPLAVDGWRCPEDGNIEFPALLSPAEVTNLLQLGEAAAKSGNLDEAEFNFRRVTSSWPGYMFGRVNLGSVYLDKIKAEQARPGGASAEVVQRYVEVAVTQFEHALTTSPPAPPQIRLMLGRLYLRSNRPERGHAVLRVLLADPSAPEALKREAQALMT